MVDILGYDVFVIFIYVMYVFLCECMSHVYILEEDKDPLELAFQVVRSCLTLVLGPKLQSSARTSHVSIELCFQPEFSKPENSKPEFSF